MTPQTAPPGAAPATTKTAADIETAGELGFLISVDDVDIGKFAECSGLGVEYDVTEYAEGGNNEFVHKLRGGVKYPNVTLRRGVTYEDDLLDWFYEVKVPDRRPTLIIKMLDRDGDVLREFALAGALPVRWTGPTITAESSKAATESLEIAHQGFV